MYFRRRLAVVFGLLCLVGLSTGFAQAGAPTKTDPTPATCDSHGVYHHIQEAKDALANAYALRHWRDASPLSHHQKYKLKRNRRCLERHSDRRRIDAFHSHVQRRFDHYRHHRLSAIHQREAVTPYPGPNGTHWAIPWYIVACESGGDYSAQNPYSSASGAYQILDSTWMTYGGGQFASRALYGTHYQQDLIAHRIWLGSGPGAWQCS